MLKHYCYFHNLCYRKFSFDELGRPYINDDTSFRILNPRCIKVWAYFEANGRFGIYRIDGSFNSAEYINLLGNLLEDPEKKSLKNSIVFVHDSHPVHKARIVREWLECQPEFSVVNWPSNFGDVMPFERLWRDLLSNLANKDTRVHNNLELWQAIEQEFLEISADHVYLNQLVYPCMCEKLQQIIDADGGSVI